MADCIEREKVYNIIERMHGWCGNRIMADDLVREIRKIPAADVAPVRHGKWELNTDNFTPAKRCSVCGYNKPEIACDCSPAKREPEHYCPNCGAKMDGEDGESNDR